MDKPLEHRLRKIVNHQWNKPPTLELEKGLNALREVMLKKETETQSSKPPVEEYSGPQSNYQ